MKECDTIFCKMSIFLSGLDMWFMWFCGCLFPYITTECAVMVILEISSKSELNEYWHKVMQKETIIQTTTKQAIRWMVMQDLFRRVQKSLACLNIEVLFLSRAFVCLCNTRFPQTCYISYNLYVVDYRYFIVILHSVTVYILSAIIYYSTV